MHTTSIRQQQWKAACNVHWRGGEQAELVVVAVGAWGCEVSKRIEQIASGFSKR